ncbi:hypothetical protein [Muricauda sp. MAR_2010_75]|uniref:hypothetical protein n=1 Tax=Allomuricauda sp. MAR_2010_75 TaxID=1250232 RepID=UPI0012E06F02|nr:hypothetical protein [Muricauda sp. MAR_2010_75]
MKTVLVFYKEWIELNHPDVDGTFIERSTVVEVEKLTDLNEMFEVIDDVKVIC